MRQIQFQKQNASTAFDPIDLGDGGLNQQINRDRQVLQDQKENLNQQIAVRNQYLQGLQRKFQAEANNREEIRRFEISTREIRDEAIRQNFETRQANFDRKIKAESENISLAAQLGTFSDSLLKKGLEYKNQLNEQELVDEYNKALVDGLPSTRLVAQSMNEAELKLAGEATEGIADAMSAGGTDQYQVQQVRSGNKWRDYGRLKAYSEMVAAQYPLWLEMELAKLGEGGLDPLTRAAAIEALQIEYLKQNKLYGLSADFLGPMFTKMRAANQQSIVEAKNNFAKQSSNYNLQDAKNVLITERSPQALTDVFKAASRVTSDGKTMLGPNNGVTQVYDMFNDIDVWADQDEVEFLLKNTFTTDQPNVSWWDRHPGKRIRLMAERERKLSEAAAATRQAENRRGKQAELQAIGLLQSYADNGQNISEEQGKQLIGEFAGLNYPTSNLQKWLDANNASAVQKREWKAVLERMWVDGDMTLRFLKENLAIPPSLRKTYVDLLSGEQATGVKRNDAREVLARKIRQSIGLDNTTQELDDTGLLAIEAAFSDYQTKLASYLRTMDPIAAQQRALDEVRTKIEEEDGQFKVDRSSSRTRGDGEMEGRGSTINTNFFPAFEPFADGRGTKPPKINFTGEIERSGVSVFQKGGTFAYLVPTETLNYINQRAKSFRRFEIPAVYFQAANAMTANDPEGKRYIVWDIFDMNLAAAFGKAPPRVPLASDGIPGLLQDSRLLDILERPTVEAQKVAILNSDISKYSSGDPRGQGVIILAAQLGVDPLDLAAIFSFETGGTLDPNQPGLGAAAGRRGLIQAGPNEMSAYGLGKGTWQSEMDGIYRYLTARGAKPGMGLEDLYAIVNGGNVNAGNTPDGNGTVARSPETLEQLMIHREQAAKTLGLVPSSEDPYMDPMYMSPTLLHFHTAGGITNGGWSEHSDIKQWDDPNTPEDEFGQRFEVDELDEYIFFNDPEHGSVTLSELRDLVGVTPGMNYGAPRSYGPHLGWDYPTKAGTKLYLRNGARKISSEVTSNNGVRTIIKLPDGRYFAFLHGE